MNALIEHLKHFEGFVGHPYKCAAGKWTIGYGHRIDGPDHPTMTEAEAEKLLLEDIAHYTLMAARLSPNIAEATPHRLYAVVDFCFNAGGAAYAGSTLRLRVDAKKWGEAAYENGRWVYVTDPVTKRKAVSAWQVKRRAVTSEWLKNG